MQHRFRGDGELGGHAVGNVLIVALWELLGDTVQGLDWVGRLLGVHGRVLPMASVPLDIGGRGGGGRPGPPAASSHRARARRLRVHHRPGPVDVAAAGGPARLPEAVAAVRDADWVVLGPGSWFTSVLPHLLVPSWPPR